ncbi:MAG TPA: hypothetical protein VLV87_03865 [Gammaproteobacteria bacterium]|nr:hypothetical protein [Gammaproteobacteria bacterium]
MSSEKRPIVVAGKRYNSVEEMPAEVRRVYDLARAAQTEAESAAPVKLIFNGKEYEGLDSMPPDVRKLYQTQQVAMETYQDFSVDATTPRAAKVDAPPQQRMQAAQPPFVKRYMWPLIIVGLIVLAILLIFI